MNKVAWVRKNMLQQTLDVLDGLAANLYIEQQRRLAAEARVRELEKKEAAA